MPTDTDPRKPRPFPEFIKYSGLGLQLLLIIGAAAYGGLQLDRYLQLSFPLFLLSFTMLAFGGMMYRLYRGLNK